MKKAIIGILIICLAVAAVVLFVQSKNDTADGNMDYMVLVNKDNKLPDGWEENLQDHLRTYHCEKGDWDVSLEENCMENILAMKEALHKEGVEMELDSGYRSVERQQEIMDEFTEEYGEEYAKTYVAIPGYSEHHTGLAVDACLVIDGVIVNENEEMVKETETWDLIHEKLVDYGFILRYPEGKEDITGYGYEPWHFRYVGEKAAKEIAKKGLAFEEYLEAK